MLPWAPRPTWEPPSDEWLEEMRRRRDQELAETDATLERLGWLVWAMGHGLYQADVPAE